MGREVNLGFIDALKKGQEALEARKYREERERKNKERIAAQKEKENKKKN